MNRRQAIAALTALPASARVRRAAVRPTDVIVIECDTPLSHRAVETITAQVKAVFRHDRVIVLDRGLHLKVLEAAAAEEEEPYGENAPSRTPGS